MLAGLRRASSMCSTRTSAMVANNLLKHNGHVSASGGARKAHRHLCRYDGGDVDTSELARLDAKELRIM